RSSSAMTTRAATSKIAARPNAVDTPCASTRTCSSAAEAPEAACAAAKFLDEVPKTATSTASPTDPPSCCMTLTMLEAAPESCGRTPASEAVVSGTNTTPIPPPSSTIGPKTPDQYPV